MSTILVGSELSYDVRQFTVLLLKISAAQTDHQKLLHEELKFAPELTLEELEVGLDGNRIYRTVAEPGTLGISYRATIDLQPEVALPAEVSETARIRIPADVLPYSNPSRYCESDLLARFAFEEFGNLEFGHQRVQAICDWVHDFLDYTPGSTNATTTASDVLLMRTGVCRDYAHLAISLCRGIGIPARYVSGYAVDLNPPDFHGFMEAFLDGRWFLFDPTKLAPLTGLVRIGIGRDAADVAFATINGDAVLSSKAVWAMHSQDSQPVAAGHQAAVSTA
ncbi:MAG: transglutaminase family protein [Pirellulaceae bacterium]|nr:transglutaminase family protein [Pirellulaceae bacterium]